MEIKTTEWIIQAKNWGNLSREDQDMAKKRDY